MAKRTKTNVGITIQSHPQVQVKKKGSELPFHILFAGNLSPLARMPSDWSDRSIVNADVNKDSFAQLLQRLAPRLSIDVPDLISRTTKAVEVNLQFQDLKDFRPESVVAQVPALERLLKIRALVEKVRKGDLPLSDFTADAEAAGLDPDLARRFRDVLSAPTESSSQTTPPTNPPAAITSKVDEGKLGSLLQMVDLGGEHPGKRPDAMDALLTAITGNEAGSIASSGQGGAKGVEGSVAEMLMADLNQMLGDQTNAILHHPEFQHLESCWRGLKFLVDRIDFRRNVRLSVLTIPKEHLNDALVHQLLNPPAEARQQLTEAPVSVVVADFEFGILPRDVDMLGEIAETMASAQLPLVASVGPAFFGVDHPSEIAELPVLWQHFQRPEYVTWNSFRDQAASAYVALALPRFLLRLPYGSDNPVKGFQFVESMVDDARSGQATISKSFLWGNPAIAMATAMARSFTESGWPTRITGADGGGTIDDLPLWQPLTRGLKSRIPLEVGIPDDKLGELSEMGFSVLATRPNNDSAYINFAPTVHRPEKYEDTDADDEARIHASLPCRLMTARIVQHLLRFEQELTLGQSRSVIQKALVTSLKSLLTVDGAQPSLGDIGVEITGSSEATNRISLKIRMMVPQEILGREVSIVLGYELKAT